ncbi:MAG TPA: hypothetical protein VL598_02995 [Trinickia sp.]|jgi:hypothetical protein|uniref:hypothetical protein n=1 Tax=Trinickia sp. TaxID=2571163 RepID=UPI002D0A8D8E|nr:hypothetical protein [Trinickia sp.]HTI16614.1 hypothetical protein [Trinickia sp.]
MPFTHLTPEEQAVLAPLEALLDGLRRRDRAAMLAQVMPEGGATIIRKGHVLHYSLRALFERDFPPGVVDEQIYDPYVRIDNDIAMIWAPYKVFIDGKLQHSGTNIMSLVRQPDGKWLIAGHLDNSRTPDE